MLLFFTDRVKNSQTASEDDDNITQPNNDTECESRMAPDQPNRETSHCSQRKKDNRDRQEQLAD